MGNAENHQGSQGPESARSPRAQGWFTRLLSRLTDREEIEPGSDAYVDKYFQKPDPSRYFGPCGPLDPPNPHPRGPSPDEVRDRALLDRAMAVEDPWGGDPPPLYSSSTENNE